MSQDEVVDIVNEKDEIIGQDIKSNKIAKSFISRVSTIFLVDSENKFIITTRSKKKKMEAGLYDLSAAGGVMSGESYIEAAKRELQEELSISCEMEMLDKFYQEIENERGLLKFFCAVFLGKTDQIPKLNDEVSEFRKMTLEEIKTEITAHPEKFCPGFINDFKQVEEKLLIKLKS